MSGHSVTCAMRLLALVLVLGSAAAVVGCGGDDGADAAPEDSGVETLTVRYAGIEGGLSAFLAGVITMQGLDDKHGIEWETTTLASTEVTRSLIAGRTDVAILGAPAALLIQKQMPDVRFLRPLYDVNHVYLALANSPISSLEDFQGKEIVGIGETSGGHVALALMLQELGLNLATDVEEISADMPVGVEAVRNGDADATVSWDPVASRLVGSGDFRLVVDLAQQWREAHEGSRLISGVLGVSQEWIDAHPDGAARVSRMFGDAIDYIVSNPDIYAEPEVQELLGMEEGQDLEPLSENIAQLLVEEWSDEQSANQVDILSRTSELEEFPAVSRDVLEQIWAPTTRYFE